MNVPKLKGETDFSDTNLNCNSEPTWRVHALRIRRVPCRSYTLSQYSTRKGKRMPAAPVPLKQKALAAPRLFSKYLKNIKSNKFD